MSTRPVSSSPRRRIVSTRVSGWLLSCTGRGITTSTCAPSSISKAAQLVVTTRRASKLRRIAQDALERVSIDPHTLV